jgi:hypothetical protein
MVIVNSDAIYKLPSQYDDDLEFAVPYANPTGSSRLEEGRLFKNQVLCVPMGPLRDTILHDHPDVACRELCQVMRRVPTREGITATTWRTDTSISSANEEMGVIYMDVLLILPLSSSGQSGIAVIFDKLSRQAHFLSLPPKFDAADLAHLYLHEFYRHHGL